MSDPTVTPDAPPRRATLYDYGERLEAVYDALLANGGVVDDEQLAALESLEYDFDTKAERVAWVIREMEGNSSLAKAESDRLAARAKALENGANGLKAYLLREMERVDRKEIKRPLVTVKVQQSNPAVHLLGLLKDVPKSYLRTRIETSLDKAAVLAQWELGGNLPKGVEVKRGTHVRIYV